jgi:uncharacterized small protein (DUF1192 family)
MSKTKSSIDLNSIAEAEVHIAYVKTDIERLQNAETHIASRQKELAMLEDHLLRLRVG